MTTMEMPMLIHILANFGFPIMITLYLLIRFETRIRKLEQAIIELKNVIHEWRINHHG
ncbi:YvrJ family protein [Caldalkalibacillus salinus]|uniref:YvrJ family protein n=1 Tax=Caldalkalibacillus salinus TaxID=2803787 RepID=UPI001924C7E7|nr:YvrJ family protein [Caldalkalibacillus salinus]